MKKKTKIILFTSLFLLVIIGAYFTISYFNNRLSNKFSYVLEKYNGNTNVPTRGIYGINDKGEMTEIIVFDYPFSNSYCGYDVLDNYLYYVHNNYLYKIDLLTDDYVPEELFEVSVSFNLKMSDKYAYVAGAIGNENSARLYSYDLETGKETEIRKNISAWSLIIDRKTNTLYFNELIDDKDVSQASNYELYKYNLNDNSEKLILENAEVFHMSEDKIYIRSFNPDPIINYVYDKKTEEVIEFDINMPYAWEYKNRILYHDSSKVMISTFNGKKELVYDFKDVAKFVTNSLLLKDNLLVSVIAFEDNNTMEAEYNYYLLNLKTKEVAKFSEEDELDYDFLQHGYNGFITIE